MNTIGQTVDLSSWLLGDQSEATSASPRLIERGKVAEAGEGLLARVSAPVVGFRDQNIFPDGGSGKARVYTRESVGFGRPWVGVGEVWSVVGIVSQRLPSRPYVGGYRLLLGTDADLSIAPPLLPVTGGVQTGWGCSAPRFTAEATPSMTGAWPECVG